MENKKIKPVFFLSVLFFIILVIWSFVSRPLGLTSGTNDTIFVVLLLLIFGWLLYSKNRQTQKEIIFITPLFSLLLTIRLYVISIILSPESFPTPINNSVAEQIRLFESFIITFIIFFVIYAFISFVVLSIGRYTAKKVISNQEED